MSRRYRHLINNQAKVQVVAQTRNAAMDKAWFVTLAAAVAGVFYFLGYYFFGGDLWRVLAGG
jgi:hypothetical protein